MSRYFSTAAVFCSVFVIGFAAKANASQMSPVSLTLSTSSKITLRIDASSGTVTATTSTGLTGTALTWIGCHDDPMFGMVPDLFGITSMDVSVGDASLTVHFGPNDGVFAQLVDVKVDGTGPHITGTTIGTGKGKFDMGGTTFGLVEGSLTYEGQGLTGGLLGTGSFDFTTTPEFFELPTGTTIQVMMTQTVDPEKYNVSLSIPINVQVNDLISAPIEVDATISGLIAATGIKMITIAPSCIAGDVDCDGDVDFQDFLLLQVGYGITSGADRSDGDIEPDGGDGDVDFQDFLVLQANYGNTSDALAGGDGLGSAAVPEPGTLILLAAGLLGLVPIVRRRFRKSA